MGQKMNETEQMTDYKEPTNIFTQELIRIFEQILFIAEVPIVCENVLQSSPRFRKWVEEKVNHE
jgi:hypothetical protein